MDYTLMHKRSMVVDITIDTATAVISSIGDLHDIRHIPVGVPTKKGKIDRGMLNEWWIGRAIPASRMGIREALQVLNIASTKELLDKAYGLSLSDQYWVKPRDSDLSWDEVNFFEHDFSDDVGDILFGEQKNHDAISLLSPDNTSDGWLKKKWKIVNGQRVLIKSGSGTVQQEPYNEAIATAICRRLKLAHVPYHLVMQGEYPFSVCPNFITKDTELVSGWNVYQSLKKQNHTSIFRHYLDCAEFLGIPNVEQGVNEMIVLDYLIGNEDRHFNNFGVLRNAETLEYLGPAPIFDSGTALWFNKTVGMISRGTKVECKPFKSSHEEQIKLVTSFECFDPEALLGLDDEIREITRDSEFLEESRVNAICHGVNRRIKELTQMMHSHIREDDIAQDVAENIKYSGI